MCVPKQILLILTAWAVPVVVIAQQSPQDVIAQGTLSVLPGAVIVYHPPGKVQDAKAVQALLTEAQDFLRKRVPGPLQYSVALFGPTEWAAINQPSTTYAQFNPGVFGAPPIVMLASEPGHGLDVLLRRFWPVDPPDGQRYAHLVALHELGHVAVRQLNVKVPADWFGEFLATYVGYTYLLDQRPADAKWWTEVNAELVKRITPRHVALQDLGAGVGLENYIWYQASLHGRVHEVADRMRWSFIERLAEISSATAESLVHDLEAVAPGFLAWAERYHGAGRP